MVALGREGAFSSPDQVHVGELYSTDSRGNPIFIADRIVP
jgi:hypothetical protein